MMKRVLTATAVAAVLAAPAFAQQPMGKSDTKADTLHRSSANMPANPGFVQQQTPERMARFQADRHQRLRSG